MRRRLGTTATALAVALIGVACGPPSGGPVSPAATGGEVSVELSPPVEVPRGQPSLASAPSLPSAVYDPAAQERPRSTPVELRVDDLQVAGAPVVPVGVRDNGEMEIPPAIEVGWYRFGSAPGESGTTVLAAHIAFDGQDGVFRHLSSLRTGAIVVVVMSDRNELRYRVTGVDQRLKEDLPPAIFAKDGESRLVLVSCGGRFDPSLHRYDSNVIAYAAPIR